jgi:cytochrome c-550 PedF
MAGILLAMLLFAQRREFKMMLTMRAGLALASLTVIAGLALAHGNVTPQPVDTSGLNPLGAEWLNENPYRGDAAQNAKAIELGSVGYLNNCAACHGLEAVSGGVAPDLRELEDGKFGDEWWMERTRKGVTQNGQSKMPHYEGIVSQEGMWAIRSYVESRPK